MIYTCPKCGFRALSPTQTAIVAAIRAGGGDYVPSEQIAAMVWPKHKPEWAVSSLRVHVRRIRRDAGDMIQSRNGWLGGGYRINPEYTGDL